MPIRLSLSSLSIALPSLLIISLHLSSSLIISPISPLTSPGQDSLFVGVVSALMSGVLTATRVSYLAGLRCLLEIVLS